MAVTPANYNTPAKWRLVVRLQLWSYAVELLQEAGAKHVWFLLILHKAHSTALLKSANKLAAERKSDIQWLCASFGWGSTKLLSWSQKDNEKTLLARQLVSMIQLLRFEKFGVNGVIEVDLEKSCQDFLKENW